MILGVMVLLRLPHAGVVGGRRKIFVGSVLAKDAKSHKNTAGNIRTFGLALIIAVITLFLLSLCMHLHSVI